MVRADPDIHQYDLLNFRKIGLKVVNDRVVVSALGMRNNYDFFSNYSDFLFPHAEHRDRLASKSGFSAVTWDVNNPNQVVGVCGSAGTDYCNTATEILPGVAYLKSPDNDVPANTFKFRLWSSTNGSSPLSLQFPFYFGNVAGLPDSLFTTRQTRQDYLVSNQLGSIAYSSDLLIPGETTKGLYVQDYRVDKVTLGGDEALIHLATFADVNYGRDEGTQRQMVNGGVFFCIEDGSRYNLRLRPVSSLNRNCFQPRVVSNTRNAAGFVVASASQLMVNQSYLAAPSMARYSVSPNTNEVLVYYVSMNNAISVVNASDASKRWDLSGPQGWSPLVNGRSASCWAELRKPSPPDFPDTKGYDFFGKFMKTAFNISFSVLVDAAFGPVGGFLAEVGADLVEDALSDIDKADPNAAWMRVYNQIKMNTACGTT